MKQLLIAIYCSVHTIKISQSCDQVFCCCLCLCFMFIFQRFSDSYLVFILENIIFSILQNQHCRTFFTNTSHKQRAALVTVLCRIYFLISKSNAKFMNQTRKRCFPKSFFCIFFFNSFFYLLIFFSNIL